MNVSFFSNYINFALQILEELDTQDSVKVFTEYDRLKSWNYYRRLRKEFETGLHDTLKQEFYNVEEYFQSDPFFEHDFILLFLEKRIIILCIYIIDVCHYYDFRDKLGADSQQGVTKGVEEISRLMQSRKSLLSQ